MTTTQDHLHAPTAHEGGCLCGRVRYRVQGAPKRTFVCHCAFCKRLTGSAFLVEPCFAVDKFAFIADAPSQYEHRSPAHGRALTVHFCATCGTHVSLQTERFPHARGVCGGTFDDPFWYGAGLHIFTESAGPWSAFPQEATCFFKHYIDERGGPETPWQGRL